MKNKKKTVTIIAIIGIGLAIIGGIGFYTCYHTWNAATCGPYLMKLLAILNISVSEWNSCENIKQEEVL